MERKLLAGALLTIGMLSGASAQDRTVKEGAELYQTHCAACHGENLVTTGVAFDILQLGAGEKARFIKALNEGKGQMPPWAGVIDDSQMQQIWAYVRSKARD